MKPLSSSQRIKQQQNKPKSIKLISYQIKNDQDKYKQSFLPNSKNKEYQTSEHKNNPIKRYNSSMKLQNKKEQLGKEQDKFIIYNMKDKKGIMNSTNNIVNTIENNAMNQPKIVNSTSQNKFKKYDPIHDSNFQPYYVHNLIYPTKSLKEQIMKIPKVKQILQKDKFVYIQDIQKRLELVGDVKNQNYQVKELINLNKLRKPIEGSKKNLLTIDKINQVKQRQEKKLTTKKKTNKRHKTNYKIPLTKKNINALNQLITDHISHNQKFKNQQVIYLSPLDYQQPFNLKKLQFMDQINPLKKKYKQKFPNLKEGVLSKNKLLLEHVILNRNIKRQMKLEKKKNQKEKEKMLMNEAWEEVQKTF